MISYIRGTLAEKNEDSAVVEAHGVGYQIFVPVPVLSELPPLGESVKIYTYFSVREDGMSLFGFLSRQDLAMFKQLIGVNGIGPKSALRIIQARRTQNKIRPEDVLAGGLEESLAVPEEISGVGQAGKEAVEALTALGYSAAEAAGAVKKVKITEEMTAEDVLKGALRHLAFL